MSVIEAYRLFLSRGLVSPFVFIVVLGPVAGYAPQSFCDAHAALSGALFSGLFTMAGFVAVISLLSYPRISQSLLGSPTYLENTRRFRRLNSKIKYFSPFEKASGLATHSAMLCILAALAQLLAAPGGSSNVTGLCVALAAVAILSATTSIYFVRENLTGWFSLLEADAVEWEEEANDLEQASRKAEVDEVDREAERVHAERLQARDYNKTGDV